MPRPDAPRKALLPIALAIAVLGSLLAAPGAGAATVTFGANLNRPADNLASCNNVSFFFAVPNCTVNSVNFQTGESVFPPVGEGIVSAVRVRVGRFTGPMQIVVEQALRQDNPFEAGKPNYACCSVVAMSQVFTPAANAVTQIPVNFRVRQDATPDQNGIYVDQHLSLSVLSPTVPIPAAVDPGSSNTFWFPAWGGVGQERAGPAGYSGLNVLMNADWDPVGAPVAPVAPGAVRAVSIPNRQALVQNARARVLLACGLDVACAGRVLLQNRNGNAAARSLVASVSARPGKGKKQGKGRNLAKRVVTYGAIKFRIKPGKRAVVRVKLNRRGKALMRNQGRPKVWVNLKMKGQAPPSKRITLKPAPRRR